MSNEWVLGIRFVKSTHLRSKCVMARLSDQLTERTGHDTGSLGDAEEEEDEKKEGGGSSRRTVSEVDLGRDTRGKGVNDDADEWWGEVGKEKKKGGGS